MTVINLIPAEAVLIRQARIRFRRLCVRLAASVIAAALLYAGITRVVTLRQAELRRLQARHAVLQEQLQSAERVLAERDFLSRKYTAIHVLQGHRKAGWFLDLLAEMLPPDCYLENLEIGSGDRSGAGAEGQAAPEDTLSAELRIVGHARDHQEVGQLMGQMLAVDCWADVNLVSVTDVADAEQGSRVDFEIRCLPATEKP
jgi:Tfp pilus assembly protein PilN